MAQDTYRRDRIERRVKALENEQAPFTPTWRSLSEMVKPGRGRFQTSQRNRPIFQFDKIINGRATQALTTAVAGMFNGTMAPSRPWVILETDDPELMEYGPVKLWFERQQERMRLVLNDTNLYGMVPIMLAEELLFGTGCMLHEDDPVTMAHFGAPTIGSYVIAQNHKLEVNTIAHKYEMTVEQIIKKFSEPGAVRPSKNISQSVRDQYDQGNYDTWYPVVRFVAENDNYYEGGRLRRNFRFKSCYYEPGNPDRDVFLEEGGYHEFPYYVPRWEVTHEDVYGTNCPGMTALGNIRQLQLEEKRKAQGLDKMVSPLLQGPAALKNVPWQNQAGFSVLYDGGGADQKGLRAVHEVNLPIGELTLDIKEVEGRINEAFYVDLFKAISNMKGIQPKNELELLQRHQERLVELGPVLERQYGDLLDPLIARTFNQMARNDLLDPPPDVLANRPLKPRYVSSLALAQQLASTGNIDKLLSYVLGVAQFYPEVLDKFDADQSVDLYGRGVGAPPSLIVPDDVVAQRREQRQQAQQAQTMLAGAQVAANTAKMASDAKLGDDNALSRLTGRTPQ